MQPIPQPENRPLAAAPNGWAISASELVLTLKHPWTTARDTSYTKRNLQVSVSRDGITGIGEAPPLQRYDESIEGCWDAAKLLAEASLTLPVWGFREFPERAAAIKGYMAVKAAFDAAFLDWHGKKAGLPLHALLGLQGRPLPLTSYSIGLDEPEMIARKVAEAADYPILKVKLGGDNDRAVMTTIASLTDKPIRIDANEGWTNAEQALTMIRFVEDFNVELIEQPMPANMLEESRWLRDKTRLPIIADESTYAVTDFTRLKGAFDGVNIKLSKAGGLQSALNRIIVARALGLKVMIGCMIESSLGISTAAQLGGLADYLDLDGHLLIEGDPYQGLQVTKGVVTLPTGPGLGVVRRTTT